MVVAATAPGSDERPSFGGPGDVGDLGGDARADRSAPRIGARPGTPSTVSVQAPGIDPRLIVAGVVVVLVVIAGYFVLRPKDATPAGGAVGTLDALTGTCIRYSSDRAQLDKAVPCTDPHDGVVVAFVTDQTSCPSETDGILATKADLAGTNGVLCIDETPAGSG